MVSIMQGCWRLRTSTIQITHFMLSLLWAVTTGSRRKMEDFATLIRHNQSGRYEDLARKSSINWVS